jgi:hypothetical protein
MVKIMISVGKYQWVVGHLSYEWTVRDTLFCRFLSLARGGSLLRSRTTSLWLGGMFVPSSWLHNCFEKITTYLCCVLFYELNCCVLTMCMRMVYMLLCRFLISCIHVYFNML